MSKTTLQLRRGSTADNSTFTGAQGEVIVNTSTNTLVVHDGTTVGGWPQAPLVSPTFTGTPSAPTATSGTNTTQIATTAFVQTAVAGVSLSGLNTSTITEGSNLYFTPARARTSVSATGSINYNNTTGVFSYTQPTNVSAFTNDAGYITSANILGSLSVASTPSGALTYNSSTGVFTFNAPVISVNGLSGAVTLTADNIAAGTTNKYVTTATVQSALAGGGVSNSMLAHSTITVNGVTLTLGDGADSITAAAGTLTGTTLASNVVTSSLTSVGTLTSLQVSVGTGSLSNAGAITVGTQNFNDVNILASFVDTANNYNHITVQNLSNGSAASSNFIAYNNAGTSTTNYALMGINSTGYNSNAFGLGALNAAGAGILVTGSTDLAVGTYGTNSIHFQVSATTNASDNLTIQGAAGATQGYVGVNNSSPAYRLDVTGDINFTGALRTSGSAGTAGYVLQSNGPSSAPSWVNFSSTGAYTVDSWNTKINGATTTFTPTSNGITLPISNPVQVLVYKNGVYQQGWLNNSRAVWNTITRYGDYTVNSSGQVVFYSTPQIGDNISAVVLGGGATTPVYTTYPFNALDIATGT